MDEWKDKVIQFKEMLCECGFEFFDWGGTIEVKIPNQHLLESIKVKYDVIDRCSSKMEMNRFVGKKFKELRK